MAKTVAKIPAQPKTIDEYKKALAAAKRDITMLRRRLKIADGDVDFLNNLIGQQSQKIERLEDRSWLSRLFNLKG